MIQIIAVAYDRPVELQLFCNCFLLQTSPDWILHIVYDGPAPQKILDIIEPFIDGNRKDGRIHFYQSPERYQKYGHPNRRMMLQSIRCNPTDYILMSNEDNYYVPRFIEFLMKEIRPKVGIIYCDTVHSHMDYNLHISQLSENFIDMGAFVVRADVARETGFNHDHFSADGTYAVECLCNCQKKGMRAIKINKPLFIHN